MKFQKNDAPLLIVLGQSNAYGHNTHLPEEAQILSPLKNVYGLSRRENLSFGLNRVTWSGYTSAGMNLGMLENQDNTWCPPHLLCTPVAGQNRCRRRVT